MNKLLTGFTLIVLGIPPAFSQEKNVPVILSVEEYSKKIQEILYNFDLNFPSTDTVFDKYSKSDSVFIFPEEIEELRKYALSTKSTRWKPEKDPSVTNIWVQHILERKTTQFNEKKSQEQEKNKNNFDLLSKQEFWKNKATVIDSYKGSSEKVLYLIPQITSFTNSFKEREYIKKIQDEINQIQETLFENGVMLFGNQSFSYREIDPNLPVSYLPDTTDDKNYQLSAEEKFASKNKNTLSFGLKTFSQEVITDSLSNLNKALHVFPEKWFPLKKTDFLGVLKRQTGVNYSLKDLFTKKERKEIQKKIISLKLFQKLKSEVFSKYTYYKYEVKNEEFVKNISNMLEWNSQKSGAGKFNIENFKKSDDTPSSLQKILKEKGFSYIIICPPSLENYF